MHSEITSNNAGAAEECLTLRSQLSDIALVPSWIERLGSQYDVHQDTQFAMNLCLEEIVSNVIRHGYGGDPDHSVVIRFSSPRPGQFALVVEDQAPHFNPLALPELPALTSLDDARDGGQGIRLVRKFADTIAYEALPGGNRITLAFHLTNNTPKGN